ncbi:MAG: SH3 domain-containing protein [Lachnospiraceae bacterium]|nr:SH3 domain-containing protein [Lachnospiraceae bacterium]
MKKFKKIIAMCMATVMAMSVMCVGAFAAETDVEIEVENIQEFPECIMIEREVIAEDGSVSIAVDPIYLLGMGYITGDGVNLRQGASTSTPSKGLMYRGDALAVYGDMRVTGPWYYVSVRSGNCNGKTGYVHMDYVTIVDPAKTVDTVTE